MVTSELPSYKFPFTTNGMHGVYISTIVPLWDTNRQHKKNNSKTQNINFKWGSLIVSSHNSIVTCILSSQLRVWHGSTWPQTFLKNKRFPHHPPPPKKKKQGNPQKHTTRNSWSRESWASGWPSSFWISSNWPSALSSILMPPMRYYTRPWWPSKMCLDTTENTTLASGGQDGFFCGEFTCALSHEFHHKKGGF